MIENMNQLFGSFKYGDQLKVDRNYVALVATAALETLLALEYSKRKSIGANNRERIWESTAREALLASPKRKVARASIAVKEFNKWGMEILHWRTSIAIEVWRANWVMGAWRARVAI